MAKRYAASPVEKGQETYQWCRILPWIYGAWVHLMETQELKDALKLWTWLYCANVFKPCSALLIFIGVSFILLGFTSDKSGSKVH